MTERDPNTGTFVSAAGPRPDPDALRTEIAELTARRTALEAQVRDRFLDCALANSFDPIAPLTEEIRQITERTAALQAQLPQIEQAERDRLADVHRKEQVARSRAVFAHCNRAKAGARDVGLALGSLRVAYEKLLDGVHGLSVTLDANSGFEVADDWQQEIERRALADIAATLRGNAPDTLAPIIEATLESARAAAGEMQRAVASTEANDPPDDTSTTEPVQQEVSDV